MFSVTLLRELFCYDPSTGALTWREREPRHFLNVSHPKAVCGKWNRRYAGTSALATPDRHGYLRGNFRGRTVLRHRVVMALITGAWPANDVDHVNGDRSDNREVNLRAVTRAENSRNAAKPARNTSGRVGVSYDRQRGKWAAFITVNYRKLSLGRYADRADAVAAREDAEKLHGFHANHGR